MKKRALINFASSLIYQFTNLLIGLLLPKFYTEIFGSTYNGLNQTISQIMSFLSVLQFGIAAASIQQMFKYIVNNDEKTISAIYWNSGKQYKKMGYFFLGIIIPIIFVFPFVIKDELNYWLVVSFVLFRALSAAIEYFFQAKYSIILIANNKTYAIYIINTALLIFSTVLHFIVLFTFENIILYQAVAVLSTLIRFVVVNTYVRKNFPYLQKNRNKKIELPDNNKRKDVLVSEVAGMIIDSTDMIVLSTFSGLIYTSIYSVYNFVVLGLGNVLGSCREAVFAGLGKTYNQDLNRFRQEFSDFESIYLFLVFFLYSVALFLFKPFILTYTANMDAEYYLVGLPILFIISRMLVNLRIPAIVAINTAGHFKEVKKYAVIEAFINAILSLILVHFWNIYGVLIGTIAGSLFRTPILIHYANKHIIKRKTFDYVKKILLWLPLFIGTYILSIFVSLDCDTLIDWVIKAIPVGIIGLICACIWMLIIDRNVFKSMLSGIIRKVFKTKEKH
ncbi:MAG: polysaccharide biosynthesis C-terminal domain-containing protein [Clostridia bacterium]|nr:polysaccharide biosynthesis C-terminal domain-containing protein [Clostridia bacterium]